MAYLSLRRLSKQFALTAAVRELSLEIAKGEFFALLGPSGCGKSTLLRMIAGLEQPSSGEIEMGGRDITRVSPRERGIGLVFQNYALFPHMTVGENVAYGLEGKRLSREEIAGRVDRMLRSVGLEGKSAMPVTTLSGGEQQRVAVARAMVVEPAILLFDEPLSNLDVALRHQTREEIRKLQRRTGITTIYVTHDQEEALTLADRLGVMRGGGLEQVGTPEELYDRPATAFVAQFLGGANVLRPGEGIPFPPPILSKLRSGDVVAIKPEAIRIVGAGGAGRTEDGPGEADATIGGVGRDADGLGGADATIGGVIVEKEYLGFTTSFIVRAGEKEFRVLSVTADLPAQCSRGDRVRCSFEWARAVVAPGG